MTDSGGSEEPILSARPLVEDAFLTVDISFDVPFHVRLNKPDYKSNHTGLTMTRRVSMYGGPKLPK